MLSVDMDGLLTQSEELFLNPSGAQTMVGLLFTVLAQCLKGALAPLCATDALLIGELKDRYMSIDMRYCPLKPEPLIITTPNTNYLLSINLGHQIVVSRCDACWGPHDWAQWPQWYFDDYDQLPYILRRPAKEDMSEHLL